MTEARTAAFAAHAAARDADDAAARAAAYADKAEIAARRNPLTGKPERP